MQQSNLARPQLARDSIGGGARQLPVCRVIFALKNLGVFVAAVDLHLDLVLLDQAQRWRHADVGHYRLIARYYPIFIDQQEWEIHAAFFGCRAQIFMPPKI